ncbi:collagen alpha-1(III) chain-like isoform X2 [Pseudopipra pipra]|uniref:collagen alpha-1(III) chain-like isoform X2 n=1 Tax=Pseudopipra pipra TaxID=415032 RepID=UPI00313A01CB
MGFAGVEVGFFGGDGSDSRGKNNKLRDLSSRQDGEGLCPGRWSTDKTAPSNGRLERAGRATEGRGAAQPPAGALGTPLVGLGVRGARGFGGSESTGLRVRGPPPPAWGRGERRWGRGSRGAGTATQPGRAPASRSGDIDRPGCRRGSPRIPSPPGPLSVRARQGRAAGPGAGNRRWERRGEATPRRGTSAEEGGWAEMPLLITRAPLLPWVSSSLERCP